MLNSVEQTPSRFPWWIILGAIVLGSAYLPTLRTPFDFIDDGNLVYPAASGTTVVGHVELWWDKVRANYEHLGPFRPVLWAHWEAFANISQGNATVWRAIRLGWCVVAAGMLLWLMRELRLHPAAALLSGAVAMWNPYRNEIWTSLTLAEGVAMPYALLALLAARKASNASRPAVWELVAIVALVAALGCKNTYVALVPAMLVLRILSDELRVRDAIRANALRASLLVLPMAVPVAHYFYFRANWHPGQYETHGPSLAQAGRILNGFKGAMGLDFVGIGIAAVLGLVVYQYRRAMLAALQPYRATLLGAVALVVSGLVVYLPMSMMSGRYTMPGVWGLDLLLGVGLSLYFAVPRSSMKIVCGAALWVGLFVLVSVNLGRQDKFHARAKMLWELLNYVETTAPDGATIAWYSGATPAGELNIEEGIHFRWHLLHRGRADLKIGLFDTTGTPLDRVELPPIGGEPDYRIWGNPAAVGERSDRVFVSEYWLGRKEFSCKIVALKPRETAAILP